VNNVHEQFVINLLLGHRTMMMMMMMMTTTTTRVMVLVMGMRGRRCQPM